MDTRKIKTDVLIVGGGTAGCFAAFVLGQQSGLKVLIAEKANIRRSGCLAAGVNALNAYITEGRVPQDYVDYAKKDAEGIVREDLLLTMSQRLNHVTEIMEQLGLVILKDENGKYVARGNRNIKINGENMKPLLAKAASEQENVTVLNHVNITDFKVEDAPDTEDAQSGEADARKAQPETADIDKVQPEKTGADKVQTRDVRVRKRVAGAYGFDVNQEIFYDIDARAVICATGGAAGLYRPNNPGFSRHKMWYPPFNTGAGYAMGLKAGAEMTTFEMRFIALRCKDTIAPTGTIAQGVGAKQVNVAGEVYETKYGLTTSQRVYGTVMEKREGRGPCYLRTEHISQAQEQELYKAYLNMAPSQTLKWLEEGKGPASANVEIEGTEPYIVGGHTASGYWVDEKRRTTLLGLYAAGDVAGGCPQKYVTGALAEGEIAAQAVAEYLADKEKVLPGVLKGGSRTEQVQNTERKQIQNSEAEQMQNPKTEQIQNPEVREAEAKKLEYEGHLSRKSAPFTPEQLEEAMQKIMDQYAGGISTDYQFNESSLKLAAEKIRALFPLAEELAASDMDDLLRIYELKERLVVCQAVIAHLGARKETRWHSFAENMDYPQKSDSWEKYVNSRMRDGEIEIIFRDLVRGGGHYEHSD